LPKRGEWIYEDLDNFRKYKVTCPHCGAWFVGNYDAYDEPSEFLYCPHCGNICNPTYLDWENELKEREKEVTEKMEETEDEVHSDI
jgi:phage terminase large subunit GpA-like protein